MNDTNPLERYLVPLRRWWWVLAAAMAIGLTVAWITLPPMPEPVEPGEIAEPGKEYRATQILLRDRSTPVTDNFSLLQLLARQGELANRVAERLDGEVEVEDVDAVELEPDEELGTLSIHAVRSTPDEAAAFVSTYAEELIAFFDERADETVEEEIQRATERLASFGDRIDELEQEVQALPEGDLDRRLLEAELQVLIEQYGALQAEARALNSEQLAARSTFETLQEPSPVAIVAGSGPGFEVPEDSRVRFGIAGMASLLLGLALVFAVHHLDRRVRTREDAEHAFGLPVIAEVPHRSAQERANHPLPVLTDPSSGAAEAFRALRLSVLLQPRWRLGTSQPTANGHVGSAVPVVGQEEPRTLLVTSTLTGEGKSTVVANLAATLAESGQRVLVIDCDFRRPGVHELLHVERGEPGLREAVGDPTSDLGELVRSTGHPNIELIPAGAPGPPPAWFLARSGVIAHRARELADVVVFDTGSLVGTNEAVALMPSVDAVLVVNRSGRVPGDRARHATQRLTRIGADVSGIVVVGGPGSDASDVHEAFRRRPRELGGVTRP